MPYENKELSRGWKIKFIDLIESGRTLCILARFEVTSPEGKTSSIRPKFSIEFIDDYFRILGDQNITDTRNKILEEKKELIKKWGLIRIEECLNKNSSIEEPEIFGKDIEWADKIAKGLVLPSSIRIDDNTYLYIPEKRIGFK